MQQRLLQTSGLDRQPHLGMDWRYGPVYGFEVWVRLYILVRNPFICLVLETFHDNVFVLRIWLNLRYGTAHPRETKVPQKNGRAQT